MSTMERHAWEVLQHIADGKRVCDAAMIMGIGPNYAKHLLRDLRRELDCETTYHLIATAFRENKIK